MTTIQQITHHLQSLPDPVCREVLQFVELLVEKTDRDLAHDEDRQWPEFSLTQAMRGMEGESDLEFTLDDLKERF
jgi:hypothetical protein